MASVRLTQTLRDEILHEVERLYADSIKEAEDSLSPDFNRRAQEAWWQLALYGKEQTFKDMPDNWKKKAERFMIKGYVNIPFVCEDTHFSYKGEFSQPTLVPVCYEHYYYGDPAELTLRPNHPLMLEYAAWESRKREAIRSKGEFKSQVKGILDTVNTLNQFLKVWPAGSKLVPQEYLQKMSERPQRSRAQQLKEEAKEEAGVDFDVLNQTLLKKVIGA